MFHRFLKLRGLTAWICVALLYAPASAAAGASSGPSAARPVGGTFRRMLGANPLTLDPAMASDMYGSAVMRQLFTGLVSFDLHLRPRPALAEFWESSRDGRTWTFTLRRGVVFHHGREVTAQDVVYSLTRLLAAPKRPPRAVLFQYLQGAQAFLQGHTTQVSGLQVLERYKVRLVLHEPLTPFLLLWGLTCPCVVPQEEVERQGAHFGRAPVGTGPFKFVRWHPDQEIVLEAHPAYYEGRPWLDRVVFQIAVGARLEDTLAAFLQGHLEETMIPSGKLDEVRRSPQYQPYQHVYKPMLSLLYLGFNTRVKPFDDRRVRQAFNYAVNKVKIVQEITGMGHLPAVGALFPGLAGYDPTLEGYAYNPAKARALLAEAGYPAGTGFPVVQLWSSQQAASTRAELAAYQRDLAAIGVQVELHFAPDWPAFAALLDQGALAMFRLIWIADMPDADNILSSLLHSASATNRMFYQNPRVDQLLEQARRERDEAQRSVAYRKVERLVMQDAPWITQSYASVYYLYQPYVRGVELSLLGKREIPLHKIWFDHRPAVQGPQGRGDAARQR